MRASRRRRFDQRQIRRTRFVMVEFRVVAVEGRAIFADDFVVVAHVAEYVRMVERRPGADAHELLRTDLDYRDAWFVVKMRYGMVGHKTLASLEFVGNSPYMRLAP